MFSSETKGWTNAADANRVIFSHSLFYSNVFHCSASRLPN